MEWNCGKGDVEIRKGRKRDFFFWCGVKEMQRGKGTGVIGMDESEENEREEVELKSGK